MITEQNAPAWFSHLVDMVYAIVKMLLKTSRYRSQCRCSSCCRFSSLHDSFHGQVSPSQYLKLTSRCAVFEVPFPHSGVAIGSGLLITISNLPGVRRSVSSSVRFSSVGLTCRYGTDLPLKNTCMRRTKLKPLITTGAG